MKSWKTTIAGIVAIGAGVWLLTIGKTIEGGALITVGIGLVSAKDNNVTGGTVKQ